MRSAFYFIFGVFLSCCLFWPTSSFAVVNGVLPTIIEQNGACREWTWEIKYDSSCYTTAQAITNPFSVTIGSMVIYYVHTSESTTDTCTGDQRTKFYGTPRSVTCPSSEPAHCSDSSVSGDEEGFNCGGSCTAECDICCATGDSYIQTTEIQCVNNQSTDIYGNCPAGFDKTYNTNTNPWTVTGCAKNYNEVLADDCSHITPNSPGGFVTSGTFNIVSMYDVATVDNQDGTSTVTETTTTTNANGTTTETVTEKIVNNTTNNVVTSTSTTTGELSAEETPGNYNLNVTDTPSDGLIPEGIVPITNSFSGFLTDAISNNAASGIIENSGITTTSPSCSVSATVWGSAFTLDFCNQQITNFLELIGTFVVGFGYILALFIVFA